mmetsp:Transcript_80419/g.142251  ORF Transcript_80419/g.142251 Transcript_80419/m.142251 type:complete len:252 (-) Transcript_80419:31-786(-)
MAAEPLVPKVTNKEGEDLAEPLPWAWDLKALKSGNPAVTVYSFVNISPPGCKIRFMLNYYGVPYEWVVGKKPDSDYQKTPVLDIGDRQINDSYIIVKNLAPLLQGRKLTEQEEKLEKKFTFEIMIALEKACASSTRDLCGCASLMGGGQGFGMGAMAPMIACCIGPRMGSGKDLLSLEEYNAYLTTELGKQAFFGGSKPTVIDVSIFGTMLPFEASGGSALKVLLGSAGSPLSNWFENMHLECAGVKSLFE